MTFPAYDEAFDDPALGRLARRVYKLAATCLGFHAYAPLPLDWLARKTGADLANLSRARSQLVRLGYLQRGKRDGHAHTYRLVHARLYRTARLRPAKP